MRKVILIMIGIVSVTFAVMPHPVVTHLAEGSWSAVAPGIDAADYSRVLEPGSRGSVIEI